MMRSTSDSVTVFTLNTDYTGLVPDGGGSHFLPKDSIGYYHNLAIAELSAEQPDWTTLSADEITRVLGAKITKVTGWGTLSQMEELTQATGSTADFNRELQLLADNDKYDVEGMCEELKVKYPEYSGQIDVLLEAIKGLQSSTTETSNTLSYCQKVLNIIDTANIDKDLRSQLRASIVVANASTKLWNAGSEQ